MNVSLGHYEPVGIHAILDVMRIHLVGTHANGLAAGPGQKDTLVDDMIIHHAARLPDIELRGPISGIGEFIPG